MGKTRNKLNPFLMGSGENEFFLVYSPKIIMVVKLEFGFFFLSRFFFLGASKVKSWVLLVNRHILAMST
jgi:hypothetical protein